MTTSAVPGRVALAALLAACLVGLGPALPASAADREFQVAQADDSEADIDDGETEAIPLATVDFGGITGSVATTSVRAANSLTSAGLHIAPRYMTRQGDVDVSTLGGLVAYPTAGGGLGGAQVSLQARLLDNLVMLADMGEKTSLGLRGPLWASNDLTLGWDARYRNDIFFYASNAVGLSAPGFGLVPGFPGAAAQGGQAAVNAEYAWKAFRFNLSPTLTVLSNRSAAGASVGADWDLDRLTVGYGADLAYNAVGNGTTEAFEQVHSAGLRFYLTDWAYMQANVHYHVADSYGTPTAILLAGIGTRLLGNFEPARGPVGPSFTAEELKEPEEAEWDSLKGRVYHSLSPSGEPGKPLTVALKVRTPKGWASIKETTKTDTKGNYLFHRLPDGEYQVVYRNDKQLQNVVGAAVSDAVKVRPKYTAKMDLDVAWDEAAILGTIASNSVSVSWGAKPTIKGPSYEVILKYAPDQPYVVGSPVSTETGTQFDVSDEVRGQKLYYTVKYWKKGGKFQGANYYGQSNYKVLEVK